MATVPVACFCTPMITVFDMFAAGTASVIVRERVLTIGEKGRTAGSAMNGEQLDR